MIVTFLSLDVNRQTYTRSCGGCNTQAGTLTLLGHLVSPSYDQTLSCLIHISRVRVTVGVYRKLTFTDFFQF